MSAPPAQGATAPAQATWADVNRDVIRTIGMPGDKYFAWLCLVVLVLCRGLRRVDLADLGRHRGGGQAHAR